LPAVGTASASTNNPATNPPKVQTKVPPPVTTDTSDCYTVEKQTYRDASGIETAQSRPDTAVVSTYVNKSGGHYISILPPAGFDPRIATDEALAAFGLNPRPASGTAREEWNKQYANFTHFEASTPAEQCSINAQFTTTLRRTGTAGT
jgi:hypothetical protein